MDTEGKVECRGSGGQRLDLALWGEDNDLFGEEIELDCVE